MNVLFELEKHIQNELGRIYLDIEKDVFSVYLEVSPDNT